MARIDHQHADDGPLDRKDRTPGPAWADVHDGPHELTIALGYQQIGLGDEVRHPANALAECSPVIVGVFVLGEGGERDAVDGFAV